jgi:hypothetical protein
MTIADLKDLLGENAALMAENEVLRNVIQRERGSVDDYATLVSFYKTAVHEERDAREDYEAKLRKAARQPRFGLFGGLTHEGEFRFGAGYVWSPW